MVITFDSSAEDSVTSAQTKSFNMTCNASNGGLFALTTYSNTSAISYAGVSMTQIIDFTPTGYPFANNTPRVQVWYLSNPATGTNSVEYTTITGTNIVLASYNYINRTQPESWDHFDSSAIGQEVTESGSISTSSSEAWAIGFFASTAQVAATMSARAGTTLRVSREADYLSGGLIGIVDSNTNINGGTYTLNVETSHSGYTTFIILSVNIPKTGGNFLPFLTK